MAREIERKFLVSGDGWRSHAETENRIRQGYLALDGEVSLRVRIIDDVRARVTVKSGAAGMARDEFEYPIPLADGLAMIGASRGRIIEKTRYAIPYQGFLWEVDVYGGALDGIVIAEVELLDETDEPPLPDWIGREVTGDPAWSNASLAVRGRPAAAAGLAFGTAG